MARRTSSRRRRGRPPGGSTATNGSPKALLSQLTDLVEQNEALTRENRELQSIVSRVSDAVGRLSSGRGRATRQSRRGSASTQPQANGRRRKRRRITDPATLERRRAALAKARQVLADKRASKKAS